MDYEIKVPYCTVEVTFLRLYPVCFVFVVSALTNRGILNEDSRDVLHAASGCFESIPPGPLAQYHGPSGFDASPCSKTACFDPSH